MRLVVDTGPVLHLHEAAALHLLPLAGEIFLPPLVLSELRALAPALWPANLPTWARLGSLQADAQEMANAWRHAGLLHGGESEALALVQQIKPDWFLTDDAAARLMANTMGVEVHGSIGLVLWTAVHGLITKPEAENYLASLEGSSLWISPRVRAKAQTALKKIFEK